MSDNAAFRQANVRRQEMLRNGVSNSGHERNCCYLNTGTGRFANISAVAGLDHIGDGRAYAMVDWDHDGDLDLWTTNRTGPRVQFLRNNAAAEHHFLTLSLEGNGKTTNRDAIGARVQIRLVGDDRPLIKTLRAGEGFLSQSSKVLHFGLGDHDQIERVTVRWPGGETEELTGMAVDNAYQLRQGRGRAEIWSRPDTTVALDASDNNPTAATDLARIPLRYRIPLPPLPYETLDGSPQLVGETNSAPTLVNLWASWCQPCLKELVEFRDHEEQWRASGLNILALSVDQLAEDDAKNPEAARAFVERQALPFDSGFASDELVGKLEAAFHYLFNFRRPWAVPTSFLLDSQGQLAVIYIGPVDVQQLAVDVDRLSLDPPAWLNAALPFHGRWADQARHPNLAALVETLFDRGFVDDALDFIDKYQDLLATSADFPVLLVRLATQLEQNDDMDRAQQLLRQAIQVDPEHGPAHAQLGKLYFHRDQDQESAQHLRQAVTLSPEDAEAHFMLARLFEKSGDLQTAIESYKAGIQLRPKLFEARVSLGTAYAAQQQWPQALEQFKEASTIKPDVVEAHYQMARVLQKSGHPQDAVSAYQRALELAPDRVDVHYSFATNFVELGQINQALMEFRKAHQLDPESLPVLNGLAWLLATQPTARREDAVTAVRLAEKAARLTNRRQPQVLDTLAAAYAAAEQFEQAVATAEQAIAVAESSHADELAEEVRQHLELYRRNKPYRQPTASGNSEPPAGN